MSQGESPTISPFLRALLDAPGPSGFEMRPGRVWREEAASIAGVQDVRTDVQGSVSARSPGPAGPR
jgi:putative aminopeptidase FrvX